MKRLLKRSLYLAIVLDLIGFLLILFPYAIVGLGLSQLPEPAAKFLQDAGVAFFLAGTGSFLIEELIKARTKDEFEVQMRSLLGETGDKLSSGLQRFLKSHITDLVRQVETLKQEIQGSNIEMISSSREKGLEQMARAIDDAESFVYIMGISLREFFQMETPCSDAISEAFRTKGKIKFRVLVLNNQSPEALERSTREEGDVNYKGVDDPEYKARTLFNETRKTLMNIQEHCPEIDLRIYDRQSLFLLITDKVAFMEPYHYGERIVDKSQEPKFFKRVAELVPLIKFRKETERGPYEQFLGHFDYVFERAKKPSEKNLSIWPF